MAKLKKHNSYILSASLMDMSASIGVGAGAPRNGMSVRSQGPAWIINNSYDRPGNLRVCDVRSMLEARMVPEARSLRPPVSKPGNSKATSVKHVAGPDLSRSNLPNNRHGVSR